MNDTADHNEDNVPPMTPAVPPTVRQEVVQRHSGVTWVKVLGLILIITASISLLWFVMGFIPNIFTPPAAFNGSNPGELTKYEIVKQQWQSWISLQAIIRFVLALLLLICGFALLNKKPWYVSLMRIWLLLKIVFVFCSGFISIMMQGDILDATTESLDSAGFNSVPGVYTSTMMSVMLVLSILWGLLLPGVLLFWFSRKKIKEDISEW